jgi:hypothetical protein
LMGATIMRHRCRRSFILVQHSLGDVSSLAPQDASPSSLQLTPCDCLPAIQLSLGDVGDCDLVCLVPLGQFKVRYT